MVSISPRWASEKLCADAAGGAPQRASANSAGASERNEGIGQSFTAIFPAGERGMYEDRYIIFQFSPFLVLFRGFADLFIVLAARQRFRNHDVVGLDPSGRADGEPAFCPRSEIA